MNLRSLMISNLQKPVSRILIGSLFGQGCLLAVSPILTRLYTPSDFSALALITGVSAVLGVVVTLSWERAVVIPEDEATAHAILRLGFISAIFSVSIVTAVAFVGRFVWSDLLNSEIFIDYWWLVPVTIAFIGAMSLVSAALIRSQDYTGLAVRNGSQGVAQATFSVVLGLLSVIPLGLIASVAVGRLAGLLGLSLRGGVHAPYRIAGRRASSLRTVALRYRRFPLVNTWSRLLNSLGLQLPIILLLSLYGSWEAGFYALTIRVVATPVGFVVDAVSQYFEGSFSQQVRSNDGGLNHAVHSFVRRQLLVGLVPTVAVGVFGASMFALIFGQQWTQAGLYAQIAVFAYYAQFVVTPVSRALVILEHQTTQLLWDVTRALLTSGSVFVCSFLELEMTWCVVSLAGSLILSYLALLFLVLKTTKAKDRISHGCK